MTGKELKELRKKYNLTQKEVAEGINASQVRISQWENNVYTISKAYQLLLKMYFAKFE